MTRRLVLRTAGGAIGGTVGGVAAAGLVAGCSSRTAEPRRPKPPDPQTVLLRSLIAGKEQMIELYQRAALSQARLAGALEPFRQRHVAHLAALRALLPKEAAATPSVSGLSPTVSASPSAEGVSLSGLRDAERKASAARPAQTAGASPALAQLLVSVGACEAVHVVALGRVRG